MRNVVVETILFSSFEPHPTKSNLSSILPPIWMKQFHGLRILIFNHDQERLVMSTSCLRESHNHDFKKRPSGSSQPAKTWVSNSVKDTISSGLATPEGRNLFSSQSVSGRLRWSVTTRAKSKHRCRSNTHNQNTCEKEWTQCRCRSVR